MPKCFTAIIVSELPGTNQNQFAKYRNVPASKLNKLMKFAAATFAGLHHINLYDKETKKFARQLKKSDIEAVATVGQSGAADLPEARRQVRQLSHS
jgi:predicted transcriptional regulator